MKRSHSPNINDPATTFTPLHQTWNQSTAPLLPSLTAPVSPPRKKPTRKRENGAPQNVNRGHNRTSLSLSAVEAGQVQVNDPVELFSARLASASRPLSASVADSRRLSIEDWVGLYARNQHDHGHHFVVHQHDHPVAGPHYDLRLQISKSSSVSWAIMYGLPGDPNTRKINRNATETRVHCLWNHMIETGSRYTGSMIIWDTGEYEVLPYHAEERVPETDDSASDISVVSAEMFDSPQLSESEKLKEAFQNRKIRLRLHGTRLPKDYTISLRLSAHEDAAARTRPTNQRPKRQRQPTASSNLKETKTPSTSRSPSPENGGHHEISRDSEELLVEDVKEEDMSKKHSISASDSESLDLKTRLTNAYPGAVNSVGSIHQRRWFITLDRANSGFVRDAKNLVWKRNGEAGFEPFYVCGPDHERSVVTARTGAEVLQDENVEGFIPRRGWRPVLN